MPNTGGAGPGALPEDWWDSAWTTRVAVHVTDPLLSEPLDDFTLLVRLGQAAPHAFDYTQAKADGSDLRFVTNAGEVLSYEVEVWDPAGESLIWLRLPKVEKAPANDQVASLWLYAGNPGASELDETQRGATWADAHTGVWHFAEDGDDSTTRGHDAVNKGTTFVDAKFGRGVSFDEAKKQYLIVSPDRAIPLVSGASGSTFSAWVNPTIPRVQSTGSQSDNDANGNVVFTIGGNSTGKHNSYTGFNISAEGRMITHVDPKDQGGYRRVRSEPGTVTMNEWSWVTYVIDLPKGEVRFFKNGEFIASVTEGAFNDTAYGQQPSSRVVIGTEEDFTKHYYDGIIDEMRIETTLRSAEWIAAQFRAMTVKTYVTLGDQ